MSRFKLMQEELPANVEGYLSDLKLERLNLKRIQRQKDHFILFMIVLSSVIGFVIGLLI